MGTKALDDLRRFVTAKDTDEERHEVRAYVREHTVDLAAAFGVSADTFTAGVANVDDDARLTRRLMVEIKRAQRERRDLRVSDRARAAQESADTLGSFALWTGDRAEVDVVSLLAACLTRRDDVLVFSCETFTVAVPMSRLFDLARLERIDLSGFVDAAGLHVRWGRSGALNFRSTVVPGASLVVVNLAPQPAALAA